MRSLIVCAVLLLPAIVMADPHGGGHGAPAPVVAPVETPTTPDTPTETNETRNQQAARGQGGGCAGCSTTSGPTSALALPLLLLALRRRD